ncbi:MAG TPA: flagellar biosynthetic protein FliR [Caulobacteraceae bacterium]|jgi:flagellar biosynthetic protein FliR|nr:flagellar biosynthetic protein FliR [Caulobacteraceae bacterium]
MGPYATAQQLFAGALVFARIAALIMTMPGLGDTPTPSRVRLAFALLMCLVITPAVYPQLPVIPLTLGELTGDVVREVLIGLAIGAILRVFMSAMSVAGEVVSIATSLSFAQTANPTQGQTNTTLATFLSIMAAVLVMTTDLHHLFIGALVRSYALFPFGHVAPVGDFTQLEIRTVGQAFALGVQLAAPILVFSLVFNLATGLVGRAMPQFQIFFAAAPLQVLLGLSLFALSLGVMGNYWLDRYRDLLSAFG